jgi:hypothetical protein
MVTTQLDKLRAALPYSSGAARREIAQQIAEAPIWEQAISRPN